MTSQTDQNLLPRWHQKSDAMLIDHCLTNKDRSCNFSCNPLLQTSSNKVVWYRLMRFSYFAIFFSSSSLLVIRDISWRCSAYEKNCVSAEIAFEELSTTTSVLLSTTKPSGTKTVLIKRVDGGRGRWSPERRAGIGRRKEDIS